MSNHLLKYEQLRKKLQALDSVVVAFTGGVDSTFLLKVAVDVLGKERVLAVTSNTETYAERERKEALDLAREIGCKHLMIRTSELNIPGYVENPINRCYFCQSELFNSLFQIAKEKRYDHVLSSAIADNDNEHWPGYKALLEHRVHAPLQEVGLTKIEIRALSFQLGLRTWDKPDCACLSSRIPYGDRITIEKLLMIDHAEQFLIDLGFREVRVRMHEKMARIEVPPQDIKKLTRMNETVVNELKSIGFTYVTIDLEGYRTGSLNETIENSELVVVK